MKYERENRGEVDERVDLKINAFFDLFERGY
jgi:hypothetical protein